MGIMDFVKGGVREMMIARPDHLKHLIVYKHPDQNIPFWSQLTVDSDECALFFKDGTYQGWLPAGRHTLQTQNIPFLNNLVNKFTGGDVFIAEIFFVKTQPTR
ncbi:MAG: SPFH domain-containing protein, partial [Polyangiaceae bacterium]|nr:SPFH domain-containing protein [Polyangiaceae bacterium]